MNFQIPEPWSDRLYFSKRERLSILSLVFLILLFWFLPDLVPGNGGPGYILNDSLTRDRREDFSVAASETEQETASPNLLFEFDPNTLDESGWKKLGLREKTIQTILNFRAKGGRFLRNEDLDRIYGLRSWEKERLKPYVRIQQVGRRPDYSETKRNDDPPEPNKRKEVLFYSNSRYNNLSGALYPKKVERRVMDINQVDSTGLESLPGIGPKLAKRILAFREKLGGFYQVDQIREVYGLEDSVFRRILPYLKMDEVNVRKININEATESELKSHPYISWKQASALVAYRNNHGRFSHPDDLLKMPLFTREWLEKIKPYIAESN